MTFVHGTKCNKMTVIQRSHSIHYNIPTEDENAEVSMLSYRVNGEYWNTYFVFIL